MVEVQIPAPLHHASEQILRQSSQEALALPLSSHSSLTRTLASHGDMNIPQTQAADPRPAETYVCPRTDSESSIGDEFVKTELESRVFPMILYLLFAVPSLTLLSFFYTIITIPLLMMSKLCGGAAIQRIILSGHRKLFRPHTNMMHIQPPENMKDITSFGIGTLPISFLVVLSGIFVVLGQVYSILLSDHDRGYRSLNRVVSLWYSWLYIFNSETHLEPTTDEIV